MRGPNGATALKAMHGCDVRRKAEIGLKHPRSEFKTDASGGFQSTRLHGLAFGVRGVELHVGTAISINAPIPNRDESNRETSTPALNPTAEFDNRFVVALLNVAVSKG